MAQETSCIEVPMPQLVDPPTSVIAGQVAKDIMLNDKNNSYKRLTVANARIWSPISC